MRIRLLTTPAHRYGGDWPPVGSVVDVPDGLAAHMLEHGEAETAPEPAPEAAVVTPHERAVKPKPRARKG